MAVHGKRSRVYANGFNLSAFLRKCQTSGEADTADASTFTDDSKVKKAGLKQGKLTAEGVFQNEHLTLDAIDDVLSSALGVEHVVWLYGPEGDAAGKRCVALQAIETSYEIDGEISDVVMVKAEAESSKGEACEGGIFLTSGAQSSSGNGADQDNTLPTSNGAACFLQVPDVVGAAPSLTVKVQHSVDGSAWVDLATFTAVTADHASQVVEVAGTVNRHVRALWTFGGTMTGATFAVAIARR